MRSNDKPIYFSILYGWTATAIVILTAQCAFAQGSDLSSFTNDPRISVLEPQEGETVIADQPVHVRVDIDPSIQVGTVVALPGGTLSGPPYEADIIIPGNVIGSYEILIGVTGVNNDGLVAAYARNIYVVPASGPVRIEVNPAFVITNLAPTSEEVEAEKLQVFGEYTSGARRFISEEQFGTHYTSLTPSIVTVDGAGTLTPISSGFGYIKVTNGSAEAISSVVVRKSNGELPGAIEVSEEVGIRYSGIEKNNETGLYMQRVTVTNNSSRPIPLPVALAIGGVAPGIEVLGNAIVRAGSNAGDPLVLAGPDIEPNSSEPFLLQGQSATGSISFRNRDGRSVSYSVKVYAGGFP